MILEWNILHRVDSLICTPKYSNHLRSHSRAIMALNHSRLDLENKSGPIFCFRPVYFTKSCQQIWGSVNQPFILFIHHIWGETVPCIIQTSDRMQYVTNFQDKLPSVNIQNDQSWAFSETVGKCPKSPIRPAGSHFWRAPNLQWTLIEIRFNKTRYMFSQKSREANSQQWE